MKIIITAKTEKGKKSTDKEVDKTCDEVVKITNSLKGKYKHIGQRFYCDGTSLIIRK